MIYAFQGFHLDPGGRRLLAADGRPVPLTSRVFDALLYLVAHRGELLDKDSLMQAVWPDTVVEENRLNQVISALRKALGERPGEQRFILTEPGRGYRFVAEVQSLTQEPDQAQAETLTPRRGVPVLIGLLVLVAVAGFGYLTLDYSSHPAKPAQSQESAMIPSTPPTTREKVIDVTPPDSIAVLPFTDMSPNKDQGYFAEGVAEEVLNQLSRIRDLLVIGRESSFSFKGKNVDLRVIGEKLGVSYLLEGSVRKEGKRVRITAQLVKAEDGRNLWSRSYDRDLEDIFAIQDDIAKSVADALQITLGVGELGRRPGMTRNIAAYDAYLSAHTTWYRLGRENFIRVIAQLEKATALDPNFAIAWSTLARAYNTAAGEFITERADEYLAKAKSAAVRVIAIAPGSIDALIADTLLQVLNRNWIAVGINEKKELRLTPLDAWTNAEYGVFLITMGRPHDAIEYLQRAVRSEPLVFAYALNLGSAYEISGDFKASLKVYERAKNLKGNLNYLNLVMLLLSMEMGNRDMLDTALENRINDNNRSLEVNLRSLLDSPDKARAELYRLYEDPKYNNFYTHDGIAHWASYFNDPQLALKIYTELSESNKLVVGRLWWPLHKAMRKLPGFKDLVLKAGLVDYWRTTGNWGEFCHPLSDDDFECE